MQARGSHGRAEVGVAIARQQPRRAARRVRRVRCVRGVRGVRCVRRVRGVRYVRRVRLAVEQCAAAALRHTPRRPYPAGPIYFTVISDYSKQCRNPKNVFNH